ncbi:aromatic prenyltransferase [Aspergillus bertholletiae]|uniref:Aromatic prenyltransferase n=1 Tax=Aspergillus bertholletiae TaxID=1226010 RepID=A0A5N7B7S1_9EURO|nr:aromatic prenyltransferase [Aspergillus bertholletiae]
MTRTKFEEAWSLGYWLEGPSVDQGLRFLLQFFEHIKILDREIEIKVEHDDRSDTSKTTPLVWNYEMRSGDSSPLTQIYLPVHGENDIRIATGIAHFMKEIGMVDIGESYLDAIQSYL